MHLLLPIVLLACSHNIEENENTTIVSTYYEIYQERTDFNKFMDFYDEAVVLEDMINGDRIIGKEKLREFFNWNNPDFQLVGDKALIIKDQIIEDQKVVTTGHFTAFKWQDFAVEAMNFTTILYFNEAGQNY